jgi:hypothetical protein
VNAYLVALLLLSPFELPVPRRVAPPLWQALKKTAWDLELTGPKCHWIADFRSEARWCRNQFRAAYQRPSITDSNYLPDTQSAHDLYTYAVKISDGMGQRIYCYDSPQDVWRQRFLAEIKERVRIWEVVLDATDPNQVWSCRRRSLADLKELLGDDAYYRHDLPAPVPWELLPER